MACPGHLTRPITEVQERNDARANLSAPGRIDDFCRRPALCPRLRDGSQCPCSSLATMDTGTLIPLAAGPQGRSRNILSPETEHNSYYLNETASLFPKPTAISCSLRTGNPAERITEVEGRDLDSLIARRTHGRSGIRRWPFRRARGSSTSILRVTAQASKVMSCCA
jgi:hypothetical protein